MGPGESGCQPPHRTRGALTHVGVVLYSPYRLVPQLRLHGAGLLASTIVFQWKVRLPAKAARRGKPKVAPLSIRPVSTPSSTPGPPGDPTWPNFAIFSKSLPSEATAPMPQPPSHSKTRKISKTSAERRLPAQLAGGLFPLFCRIPRTHSSSLGQGSPPLLVVDLPRLREMPLAPTTPTSSRGLCYTRPVSTFICH